MNNVIEQEKFKNDEHEAEGSITARNIIITSAVGLGGELLWIFAQLAKGFQDPYYSNNQEVLLATAAFAITALVLIGSSAYEKHIREQNELEMLEKRKLNLSTNSDIQTSGEENVSASSIHQVYADFEVQVQAEQ